MKLVLQCGVCGTNHTVGTTACTTCRATGLEHLRLLFECPKCFKLGLTPHCQACIPQSFEVVPDPKELARLWGVDPDTGEALVSEFVDDKSLDTGEFELMIDDDEPEEDLTIDDEP